MMSSELSTVKIGLAIVLISLFFGIGLGIAFGVNEDAFKDYVSEGMPLIPRCMTNPAKTRSGVMPSEPTSMPAALPRSAWDLSSSLCSRICHKN